MNLFKTLAILCALMANLAGLAQDWRLVNQASVDLGPLHEWLKGGHQGERPLSHWKELHLVDITGGLHPYDKCLVRFEDGKLIEIYLGNLEPQIRLAFTRVKEVQTQIDQLESQIINDQEQLDNLPTGAKFRTQRATLTASINRSKQSVSKLNRDLANWNNQKDISSKVSILAMHRGLNVAGLPLWDCGVKINPKRQASK